MDVVHAPKVQLCCEGCRAVCVSHQETDRCRAGVFHAHDATARAAASVVSVRFVVWWVRCVGSEEEERA